MICLPLASPLLLIRVGSLVAGGTRGRGIVGGVPSRALTATLERRGRGRRNEVVETMENEEGKKRVRGLSSGLQGMRFMQRKRGREYVDRIGGRGGGEGGGVGSSEKTSGENGEEDLDGRQQGRLWTKRSRTGEDKRQDGSRDGSTSQVKPLSPIRGAQSPKKTGGVRVIDESGFGASFQMIGRRSFNKFNVAFESSLGSAESKLRTNEQKIERDAAVPAEEVAIWRSKQKQRQMQRPS